MARRITPAQFQSMMRQAQQKVRQAQQRAEQQLRQAQQKQKQAVDQLNREIRSHNQKVQQHNQKLRQNDQALRSAVNNYNSAVRAHNSRVRADQQRRKSELARLNSRPIPTRYVTLRSSVQSVEDSFAALERRADHGDIPDRVGALVDVSEREAANSASVMNAILGDAGNVEDTPQEEADSVIEFLMNVSPDLADRWRGALFALSPQNPDAARHFCTSAREVFTEILETHAPDAQVVAKSPDCDKTGQGKPTRRAKIRYFLRNKGIDDAGLEDFVERDLQNVVDLFQVFNDGTHGSAGKFDLKQLRALRKRVEDGIGFLERVIH